MKRFHFFFVIAVLLSLGLGLFIYKWKWLGFPLEKQEVSTTWDIETKLSFYGTGKGTKISMFVPQSSKQHVVLDESFISSGFGIDTELDSNNKKVTWAVRRANGRKVIFYKAKIHLQGEADSSAFKSFPIKDSVVRQDALKTAVESILSRVSEKASDTESFVKELGKSLKKKDLEEDAQALLGRNPKGNKFASIFVELLNEKKITSRVVNGIRLSSSNSSPDIIQWIEVWDKDNKQRLHFNLKGKKIDTSEFLPWWYGTAPLTFRNGGRKVHTSFTLVPSEDQALDTALTASDVTASSVVKYSLFSLPISTQLVFKTLLLVPVGAIVVAFLRNIIGLITYGTFLPVLIALSFRETELLWGVVLFSIITSIGLFARFYLDQFRLLLVPRLVSMLCIVVIAMLCLSIITFKLDITHGLSIALFPMVILAMAIERMSIAWDEKGAAKALQQAIGTLLVACLCYLVMIQEKLEYVLFVFPELLLVLLVISMLIGRYTGFRLFELFRFRELSSIEYSTDSEKANVL